MKAYICPYYRAAYTKLLDLSTGDSGPPKSKTPGRAKATRNPLRCWPGDDKHLADVVHPRTAFGLRSFSGPPFNYADMKLQCSVLENLPQTSVSPCRRSLESPKADSEPAAGNQAGETEVIDERDAP